MSKIKLNKKMRERCDMSQDDLSKKLKVDRTTVVKWETGAALPRTTMLPDIARALNCKIDDLLCS